MKVKKIVIAICTEEPDKAVNVILHDVDQISDEIHAQAAHDKLAHAVAGIIDFAGTAAEIYEDAHALVIDSENVHHFDEHPKVKAKAAPKAAAKKKAKKKKAKKQPPAASDEASSQ